MSKVMKRLEKLTELIEKDKTIKRHQEKLNEEIQTFISSELGLTGPATLLDISKKLLETSFEESRIITTT